MNTIFDDFTREIARGITRRDALRRMGGAVAGMMLGAFGLKKAEAQTTVTCGTCQACNLDTNTCGAACSPTTTGQTLCTMASTDGSYLRLVNYLMSLGFVISGASNAVQFYQSGSLFSTGLTTNFTNASVSGETAVLMYSLSPTGDITAYALVMQSNVAILGLNVDSNGAIVHAVFPQQIGSSSQSGTNFGASALGASSVVRSQSSLGAHPEVLTVQGVCVYIENKLCSKVAAGFIDCELTGTEICAALNIEDGELALPICEYIIYKLCSTGTADACKAIANELCTCAPNVACSDPNYLLGCCPACMDCTNGNKCTPSTTCTSIDAGECCGNICCSAGQTCVNNVCTNPNSGCYGATCETYSACNGDSACFCGTIEGGTLCQTSISCSGLAPCPNGTCADGSVCLYGSCCDQPVCVPLSVECPTTVSAVRPALPRTTEAQTGPWTGHR